ncbi:MAG: glycosyltransferase [Pseudomonadota bacterium]
MRLAYLVNQYPKVSHSFIRREIEAVEAMGCEVLRFSLRRTDPAGLADPADRAEAGRTAAVLGAGAAGLLGALAAEVRRAPGAVAAQARLAWRLGGRGERGRRVHLIYLAEACWLARRLRGGGVQHLHAHFGTNSATVAMLAAALADIPWSFTVHGPEEFDKPQAIALGEKIARARAAFAISSYGRSQLYRWARAEDWPKIEVVRCGLPAALLEDAGAPIPDAPHLVCVGRLAEQKGQLLLLEAAAEARRHIPDLRLTLVGDGEMRAAVEARIAALGLQEAVAITGWASEAEVRAHILSARALVLGSFAEGLPVVIMEALALGRPAISTYIAGIPELVDEGCGRLVPAGDVAELSQAMRDLLGASPEHLAALGAEGRARVAARHDQRREAARLLSRLRPTPEAGVDA